MGNAQAGAERQDPQTFLTHVADPGRYVFRRILGGIYIVDLFYLS